MFLLLSAENLSAPYLGARQAGPAGHPSLVAVISRASGEKDHRPHCHEPGCAGGRERGGGRALCPAGGREPQYLLRQVCDPVRAARRTLPHGHGHRAGQDSEAQKGEAASSYAFLPPEQEQSLPTGEGRWERGRKLLHPICLPACLTR